MTRTPNYVVAYEATKTGREAVELGVALARLTGSELRICVVMPLATTGPSRVASSNADYEAHLARQAEEWLEEAVELLPDDVVATTHVRWAESTPEGLLDAVDEFESDRIVVGAARSGLLGRIVVGSVASALLHASPVPVALAPRGYRAPDAIGRITCAIGTRPGWEALLDSMVAVSEGLDVRLRFVTLVELGADAAAPRQALAHLTTVLEYFSARSTGSGVTTTEVGTGRDIEDAVEKLDWHADEIAFVGSSRLASPSRIFLGATANRMLRTLPVPLVVVPATPARP
jgi:nucleotide-binding universal stress UspA family protein